MHTLIRFGMSFYISMKLTLKLVPERIISRLSKCTRKSKHIQTDTMTSFIGRNRKIVLQFSVFFSLFIPNSFTCICSIHSQAIALLNNHNNKCSTWVLCAKMLHFNVNASVCKENYLLFRSIFLWWCFLISFRLCGAHIRLKENVEEEEKKFDITIYNI